MYIKRTGRYTAMIFLVVIAFAFGAAFILFGYLILFKKKYDLINGFTADFREGRRDERYARCIGLIEFVTGIVLVLIGVSLLLLTANGWM